MSSAGLIITVYSWTDSRLPNHIIGSNDTCYVCVTETFQLNPVPSHQNQEDMEDNSFMIYIVLAALVPLLLGMVAIYFISKKFARKEMEEAKVRQAAANCAEQIRRERFDSHGGNGEGVWTDPLIVNKRIQFTDVILDSLLSRGAYGIVYAGSYMGQAVAVKKLPKSSCYDMDQITKFFAEVKLMATLDHIRIVQFVGVAWRMVSDVCAVLELMEGGDLRSLLDQFIKQGRVEGLDKDTIKIALHVAEALVYIHTLDPIVVHRDLKSRNILLNTAGDAKVTDFGVSRIVSDDTMTAGVGTAMWMAPEVLIGGQYDEKADVFSFGVLLSELNNHLLPYTNATDMESGQNIAPTIIAHMVANGSLSVTFSTSALHSVVELGHSCVTIDPRSRPTSIEVLLQLQLIQHEVEDASFVLSKSPMLEPQRS